MPWSMIEELKSILVKVLPKFGIGSVNENEAKITSRIMECREILSAGIFMGTEVWVVVLVV
jgi:hypothetical protein